MNPVAVGSGSAGGIGPFITVSTQIFFMSSLTHHSGARDSVSISS